MQRNDTSASVGLSASLVVHGVIALAIILLYIREVDHSGYYPPLPKPIGYAGLWLVDGRDYPDLPRLTPPAAPAEVKPPELPKPQLPKPRLPERKKPEPWEDPRFLRFGDPEGTGEAINSGEGDQPLRAREGPQDQAWLSRDPEGPNRRMPLEPSMSTAVPGDGGSGPRGGPGRPGQLRLPARPTEPEKPAFGVRSAPPTPQLMPRRAVPSPAAAVAVTPPPPPPPPPPALPPATPPQPGGARVVEPLIAMGKEPPSPRIIVLTTQPGPVLPTTRPLLVQGPGDVPAILPVPATPPMATTRPSRTQVASTLPASPDSTAREPRPNAAPTTAPTIAATTQPARQYANKPVESPRYDTTGQSTTEKPAKDAPSPTTRPVLALRPTTMPAMAMVTPAVPPSPASAAAQQARPAQPASSAGGGGAGGSGGRPGPKVAPADPAPMSESESDAFAKSGSVDFKGGKVSARLGRKVRTIKPRLTLKGELDIFSIMQPSVILKVSIDETGKVTNVDNLKSSGSNEVDHPTILAVYQWWIEPKKDKAGNPVADVIVLTLTWH